MSTQTLAGHHFPTPCKRCGGALYRQVDCCPYCGAVHPLDTDPPVHSTLHATRVSPMNMSTLHDSFGPPAINEPDFPGGALHAGVNLAPATALHASSSLLSHDTPMVPLPEPVEFAYRSRLRIRNALLTIAAVVATGLAYVGYALFSDSRESRYGSSEQAAETTHDARTTTGTIARYTPDPATDSRAIATPGKAVMAANAPNVIQMTSTAPPIAAASAKPAAPQFRSAAQALQSARVAFNANDLSAAQAALGAALSLQPDSSDAQSLASELKPLTARRDAALLAAQMCAGQQSWPCAREHANEALAIDTGNDAAKTILERVIRETGWAPLTSPPVTGAQAHRQVANQ
ncbi:hypothetical protein [Paraburkholderia rhynchosiae]|uniref:Zinc ribbon domain-containing protein n=1 Tax=Paraburkholderia rhynchosiae TaxID=487049 RepID=A0A2N7WJ99_9BURK|nr:hypothetical protein [Paraburkholderia rhynchosiae]PMS29536.1 hypothetical protein C0Z16_18380 [Paraburkholderia rhynchosiae]CAB3706605.1 hypothetical protein LMG27174_03983 [Paraburkholderia rhynchosiae]